VVGKVTRIDAMKQALQTSNPQFTFMSQLPSVEFCLNFDVLIACDASLEHLEDLNTKVRAKQIPFIMVDNAGLLACVFCDFGDNFSYQHGDGKELKQKNVLAKVKGLEPTQKTQLGRFGKGKNQIPEKYYLFTAVIKIDL
jgi:hypothetical protein